MPRPVHFEIHASEPERAIRFYQSVFGWEFSKWGPMDYWLIKTGEGGQPGIDGGLVPRRGEPPADGQAVNAFPCTMDTKDIDASIALAEKAGGTIALPKMPVPGVGWLCYIKDTEGNIFGLMQEDKQAR
ncbi:MAG TPA: VOC family protein [Pseudomonadota bacterium]|nr:VOC family protein [Pseudomonadota bacterium]